MNNKLQLRKQAKLIRQSLDINTISKKIVDKILLEDYFITARNIMIFYPLEFEINLKSLLNIENKHFYLPKINNNTLEACPYNIEDELIEGLFKTKEPKTKPIDTSILDLIFVPALMVDKNNYRLGYGKGFYDIFLKNISAVTVVPIAEELIVDKLPTESHDKKIDIIITD